MVRDAFDRARGPPSSKTKSREVRILLAAAVVASRSSPSVSLAFRVVAA